MYTSFWHVSGQFLDQHSQIWRHKANSPECHVEGNSELAAILETPEAGREEGDLGCDGLFSGQMLGWKKTVYSPQH